jgi:hypothetical protein
MPIPNGAEALRPFLPTRDFAVSRAFYEALGFKKLLDSEVAIFAIGSGGAAIILHPPIAEGATDNLMVQLMVDDLDAWWGHIQTLNLVERFGVQPPRAPAVQPWGLRIAYLIDPAGVLWHVAERRPGKDHDFG